MGRLDDIVARERSNAGKDFEVPSPRRAIEEIERAESRERARPTPAFALADERGNRRSIVMFAVFGVLFAAIAVAIVVTS
jgi:hypothetical protein|nr:hypothetical protein [Kofleriaceae bacterium]